MTFPTAGDEIYRNEAGEVTGWSKPAEADYCPIHGLNFFQAECPECVAESEYDEDEDDEDERAAVSKQWAEDWESEEDAVYDEYDPEGYGARLAALRRVEY